ncbi:MAG: flagellar motor protein MotB [Verrucomicrobiota bacterium]|nr:flagellar motor protein MotB [Verrucomicrobiota bacterium]
MAIHSNRQKFVILSFVLGIATITSVSTAIYFHHRMTFREKQLQQTQDDLAQQQDANRQSEDRIAALELNIKNRSSEMEKKVGEVQQLSLNLAESKVQMQQLNEEKDKIADSLNKLKDELQKQSGTNKDVPVGEAEGVLTIRVAEKIISEPGKIGLSDQGKQVLDKICLLMKKYPERKVRIEGHTDNSPVSAKMRDEYPTNWELSSMRATAAVRYLQDHCNVESSRLQALALADSKPLAPNDTEENRAKNRRLEIVLLPALNEIPKKAPAQKSAGAPEKKTDAAPETDPGSVMQATPSTGGTADVIAGENPVEPPAKPAPASKKKSKKK